MRKPLSLAVTGIVSVGWVGLAACGSTSTSGSGSPAASAPITIGVSVSLTGDFSGDGKALVQGYDLWAQDENRKGGLLGHHVTMKYVDDASSTAQVVTNYQNLITQDKVALVFGPFSSLLTIPASTVTNRFGYAFPEPAGGGPSVFNRTPAIHSLFFVQPAPVEDNLVSFTQWVLSLPAAQRPATAAYSTEDDPFTQPQVDKARALLEAGGIRTASYKVYPAETTDFTPLAQQVISANADIVILGTQEPDGIAFIKAFQQQHYNPKALIETAGPDQGSDFSKQVGVANTEGVMVPAGWWSSAKTPNNATFVSEFVAKYGGTPGDIPSDAPEAYSVGEVVDQAAQKAHSILNSALITALHSGTFQTVQGPMAFDSLGRPNGASFLVQWQNGTTVPYIRPPQRSLNPNTPSPPSPGDPGPGARMTLILEAVVFGVLTGGVYALMASGLTLIFGVMRIINVGHGALVILGAYLSFALLNSGAHIDPFVSLLITMPAMFIVGVVLQVAFIRPLKEDREALSVLVTYAVALGIEGLLGFIFTNNFVQLSAWYETASFPILGFHIAYVYVFGFGLCVAILAGIFLLLYRTPFGAAIRATMLNRTAAQLVGVNVDRVSALAFGIGVATAAAGGVVFGMTTSFDPGSHYDLISRLLTIIVLGGLGSLRGAIIGAIAMLIVEDVAAVVISPVWASFAFFVILVVVLVVRPQGLYGIRVRERI